MARLEDFLPDAPTLLALEPEELAGYVLEYMHALSPEETESQLNRHNFHLRNTVVGYPQELHDDIISALMEAWSWLEHEGLLAPSPKQGGNWVFITRRGRKLKNHVDVEAFRAAKLLPRAQLHPLIAEAVSAEFVRGRYDTAVFNALREVEVAVRHAGGFTAADYGEPLMRNAFNKDTGPLTDKSVPESERLALSHLFAGAFGHYRNSTAHRRVSMKPVEAAEVIVLASQLMRIVDQRATAAATDHNIEQGGQHGQTR